MASTGSPGKKVKSREYKLMLIHGGFSDRKAAVESFWDDVLALASSLDMGADGSWAPAGRRTLAFLDTPDCTLRRSGVILRRRVEEEGAREVSYTLKCRSEDRYVADGFDVREAAGLPAEDKFEEDIAAPFLSRFSHSNTVTFSVNEDRGTPKTLKEAARLFPVLGQLECDGLKCSPDTPLLAVNGFEVCETVYKGPKLDFRTEKATVALILWSRGFKGRPLAAEFSFRYGNKEEVYPPAVASLARRFFEAAQRLDWCQTDGMTKTQFMYRGAV